MTGLRALLWISARHLRARARQSLVAILTAALGAMILVVTLAMMEGLLEEFKQKLLEASPPVIVAGKPPTGARWLEGLGPGEGGSSLRSLRRGSPPNQRDELRRTAELVALFETLEGVVAISPRACSPAVAYHGARQERALVCGIDPGRERQVTRLWRWMRAGRLEDLSGGPGGVVLGRILAKRLSARVGSRLRLVSPGGVVMELRVVGVFASGVTRIDERQAYVRLPEGRRLAGIGAGGATAIGLNVVPLERAAEVARAIARLTGAEALTWEEANSSAIGAFRMMGLTTYLLVIFTAVVGGFGILNVIGAIVMEKTHDIAIIRSMGYSAGQVTLVFFAEALALGVVGGLVGCGLGYGLSELIESIPMPVGDAGSLQRENLGMLQSPWFYLIAFSISLGVSLVAGVGPARRAAQVDPAEAIRGER